MPHLHIYGQQNSGEVSPGKLLQQVKQQRQISADEKALSKHVDSNVKVYKPEVKSKIMKESGQVGLNQPYRAPVYRTYMECIRGLYK